MSTSFHGSGGDRVLDNSGVSYKAAGKNCGLIAGRPIFDIYTRAERREVSRRFLHWWYPDHGHTEEGLDQKEKKRELCI